MKALVCRSFGPVDALEIGDLPEPVPGPGEILIQVDAAGVNFPDVLIVQGRYQFRPEVPFAPGGEAAGRVLAVGEGVDAFRPGDRVAAVTLWGAFAERAVARADQAIALPDGVDDRVASALILAYGTALHGLQDRLELQDGETLLVLGAAGGVGLAAVEVGSALGATVVAAASSAEKLALAREHGAVHLIDYSREDLRTRLKEIAGERGIDAVFDPVGGSMAEPALRAMAWEGRYGVVGFAAGEIPRIPLNLVLLKGCAVVGVFWGAFARRSPERNREHLTRLLRWLQEGVVRPRVERVFPLAKAADALRRIEARQAIGKLVVEMDETAGLV